MKDIASLTGRLTQQTEQKQTGSQPGETGYAARPPRLYGLDHEPTEPPPVPARVSRPALPRKSASMMPSHLPPLRQVTLSVAQDGSRITAMVLAHRADLPALKSSIAEMRAALTPPTPEEIAASVARLFSHYPSPQSGNTMTVAQDWIEDMGQVSAVAFHAAVVEWRKGANAFRPSPGQLLALIERIEAPVRDRLEFALEVEARESGMSTRERIAHLHHRQYELEMGMVPYEVHAKGYDEIQRYLEAEMAIVKSEIAQLEQGT